MTIQNWALRPDAAIIVCDTIVTDMASNRPTHFISKAFVVPHRSLMIAPLAWAHPAMTLYSNIALGNGPESVDNLAAYATDVLYAAASQYPRPQDWHRFAGAGLFVWNEVTNEIEGWRFLARNRFRAERMEPNGDVTLRPKPTANVNGLCWYDVARHQQAEDREIHPFDRDNLGGHVLAYEMAIDPSGRLPPTIMIRNFGRLPHFHEQAIQIERAQVDLKLASIELAEVV